MGGRYWITGAQIGMLVAFNDMGEKKKAGKLLESIAENQFLGKVGDIVRLPARRKPAEKCEGVK